MRALRRFLRRTIALARWRENEHRLQEEVEAHLAFQTAENIRSGLSPEEARRQAVLKFGAVESMKENYREQRGMPFLEALIQDLRHTLRRLRNAPAFTIATVLTLALGIGATTSIFSLVYAVLLKSLAMASPDELYRLGKASHCCYMGGYSQQNEFSLVSYELYRHFRDNSKGFAELAAFSATNPLFGVRRAGGVEPAESFPGEFVSGNYFTMFGVNAYTGRTFSSADDRPNAPPVAVMSYRLWQQRYGSDHAVIGTVFDLNDKPFTMVGIAPPGFFGDTLRSNPPDFYLPLNSEPFVERDTDLYTPSNHWLELIGRIRPGVAAASIEAEMRVELKQWLRSHWADMDANDRTKFSQQTLFLKPGGAGISRMREDYEHWLRILMMASTFVLLIVCANIANLMLVRGIEQRQQISLSIALGAQARRLVRQVLTESILLSVLGGVAGLAIAFAGTSMILHFAFPKTNGLAGVPIAASPSLPVLLFTAAVSVVTGIAFGIAPAWIATRVDPIEALRGANRSTVRTGAPLRKMLVVFQAALSLVLLSASGLLTSALHRLERQDFGFDPEGRIVMHMNPKFAGYGGEQLTPLYHRIHDAVVAIPGVSSAALCNYSPLSGGGWASGVWVEGRPAPGLNEDILTFWDRVTPGFFDALGNPIVRGRAIAERDTAASRHVAVINEAFAKKFFRNEDPIGKHFGRLELGTSHQYEIAGVAKDARFLAFNLNKPVGPFFFVPESQHDFPIKAPSTEVSPGSHFMQDIVIFTKPGARLSEGRLRQAVASVDPNLPIASIRTLKEQVSLQFAQQQLIARLTSLFGIVSLVLASIGLYGVTAYNAGRRTGEIGVRLALGAESGDVIALILKGAFGLILVGVLLGLPLAFSAGRVLGTQLYGLNPYNPLLTLVAVMALGLSAFVASLIPALRASLISPAEALRAE